jgi:hemolysin activation/secretion protein
MFAKKEISCLLAGLCLSPLAVMAQQAPPTAGQILQQATPPPRLPTTEAPRTVIEGDAATQSGGGERVAVGSIRFTGNTVFSKSDLQGLVADSVDRANKSMSLDELNALALRVTRYYRDHGYLVARAWLPPQEIRDGVVTLAVLEGRIGQVVLNNQAGVAANATAPVHRLQPGDAVNSQVLEGALLRLTDLPGVEVTSTLRPGASIGASDFLVDLLPAAPLTGSVDLDNFGNRYVGAERLGTSLYWNNPASLGDQLSLRAQTGAGDYRYGRLGYQVPFGPYATRVGAAWSTMHYELGKDFSSLDASGEASVGSLYVQQPLLRSRRASWYAALQYDDKRLQDDVGATGTRSRKTLQNGTASFYGNFVDALGGGASNSLNVSYTRGQLDLDSISELIDRASARSSGGFGKWSLSYQRQQRLPGGWLLTINANGQWAEHNLDSSEKLSLGGATGVRAYPQGEATGDSGHVVNLELHHALFGGLEAFGFYDRGRVRINRDPWTATGTNHRRLAGYGIGAAYAVAPFSLQAFAAWKDGTGAPLSDVDRSPRVWVQAVFQF